VIESIHVKIAPSIASGPLISLEKTIHDLETAGSSIIHFDIEDGSFVPVMNLGVKIIGELRPLTKLPFDVHLMMVNPEWLIPELGVMGADMVSVHYEACPYPRRTLRLITEHGMQAGLAFNPSTQIPDLEFCLPYLSFIVILTTEPEEGDCPYLPSVLNKIIKGKLHPELKKLTWIADGDISSKNAKEVVNAGADVLVVGRGIFKEGEILKNILDIKSAIAP
jgi:ribulose-phosphate 3-epimerase